MIYIIYYNNIVKQSIVHDKNMIETSDEEANEDEDFLAKEFKEYRALVLSISEDLDDEDIQIGEEDSNDDKEDDLIEGIKELRIAAL